MAGTPNRTRGRKATRFSRTRSARPGIVEQRRGSAEPGKEQAVAHAIAEEHLGNRIQPVSRLQCQQLRSERPAETERVAQAVHHPLWAPRWNPRCIAGNRLPPGPGDSTQSRFRGRPARPARNARVCRAAARWVNGAKGPLTARCTAFTHHQAGLAVGSDIGQGLLAGLGIDHGGNGADRDAGQEQAGQRRRVVQRQHHAIAGLEQAGQLAGLGENVGPALQPAESLAPIVINGGIGIEIEAEQNLGQVGQCGHDRTFPLQRYASGSGDT